MEGIASPPRERNEPKQACRLVARSSRSPLMKSFLSPPILHTCPGCFCVFFVEESPMSAPVDGDVVRRLWEEVLFLESLSPMTQLGVNSETSRFRGAAFMSIGAGEPTAEGFPQP